MTRRQNRERMRRWRSVPENKKRERTLAKLLRWMREEPDNPEWREMYEKARRAA